MTDPQSPLATHLDEILDRLSGGQSLRSICRDLDLKESTVRGWFAADESLAKRKATAIEQGCDSLADECFDIADDARNDWMTKQREDGSTDEVFQSEHVQRSKLRIDTRLRLIGKWSQRYSEKLAHTGADGGAIKVERVERVIVDPSNTHS